MIGDWVIGDWKVGENNIAHHFIFIKQLNS
jgi:hypothetical protein